MTSCLAAALAFSDANSSCTLLRRVWKVSKPSCSSSFRTKVSQAHAQKMASWPVLPTEAVMGLHGNSEPT